MNVEDEWLTGLRRGDAAAYESLISRYEGPLYRFFLSAHGDAQLAGEQSADCFGELVRAIPKMKGGRENLRAFVFGVARNVLRRSWRSNHNQIARLEAANDTAYPGPSPGMSAEHREELARVLAALRELDPATREVFLLHCVEQLPLIEVAAITGEPLGTVKSRIHRGRQRLDALLGRAEKP
jgi:RNA polymerase sigma-70 factor (ECF subfamily)